jgi:hypothetical protein
VVDSCLLIYCLFHGQIYVIDLLHIIVSIHLYLDEYSFSVYQNVKIEGLAFHHRNGVECQLRFELTPELKKVRWESAKKLTYGSLVCLSHDGFKSCFFAVVINSDNLRNVRKDCLHLTFTFTFSIRIRRRRT